MTLAPGQQRKLIKIENRLRKSDPALAVMCESLSRHRCRAENPAREPISPWRPVLWRAAPWAGAAVMLMLTLLGLVLAYHPIRAAVAAGTGCAGPASAARCESGGATGPGSGPGQGTESLTPHQAGSGRRPSSPAGPGLISEAGGSRPGGRTVPPGGSPLHGITASAGAGTRKDAQAPAPPRPTSREP